MRLFKLAAAFIFVTLCFAACDGDDTNTGRPANTSNARPANAAAQANASQAAATPDEFAAARAVYANECKRCHQDDGRGGVIEEPGLKPFRVPSLREGHALDHTDAQLARQIANGGEGMPAFKGKLQPEQITQLVAFIRKEFQGETTAVQPSAHSTNGR